MTDLNARPDSRSLAQESRRAAGRASWGVADQAISSLTNLVFGIAVARVVSVDDFGRYAIAFATYLLVLNVARAVATEPLMIRYSYADANQWRTSTRRAAGAALATGLLSGLLCIGLGATGFLPISAELVALGISLPGLMLQDAWRYAFFAAGRGALAFSNDAVWGGLVLGLIFLVPPGDRTSAELIAGWGLAGTVAAVVGVFQARLLPETHRALAWWRDHHDLVRALLSQRVITIGGTYLMINLVALVAGLGVVGAIRAGELIMGPVNVAQMGLGLVVMPEAVRALRHAQQRFLRITAMFAVALSVGIVVWSSIALAVPSSTGAAFLGASWEPGRQLILPFMIMWIALVIKEGAMIGLRALESGRRLVLVAAFTAVGAQIAAVAGALLGSAVAIVSAHSIVQWVSAALAWRWFRGALGNRAAPETAVAASPTGLSVPKGGSAGGPIDLRRT